METFTLEVAKTFPTSGPIRIIVCVNGPLLHHFDKSLPVDLAKDYFMTWPERPVSRRLARMAVNTCLGPDVEVPKIREAYMGGLKNDGWALMIRVDLSVPPGEDDPQVVYLQSKAELDDDGNVVFIPVVPRTAKARAKYHEIWTLHEEDLDQEPITT